MELWYFPMSVRSIIPSVPRLTFGSDHLRQIQEQQKKIREKLAQLPPDSDHLLIGRHQDSYVPPLLIPNNLLTTQVSRRHGEIWRDKDGQLHYQDLGSRFGTQINGVSIPAFCPATIKPGDRLTLGGIVEIEI